MRVSWGGSRGKLWFGTHVFRSCLPGVKDWINQILTFPGQLSQFFRGRRG